MIGSFWNLCRACPSMPVDKLHSEYRSTYRWHEYTGPRQEVVRSAPQANAAHPHDEKRHDFHKATRIDEESHEQPQMEPAMPRRKKYPDLAYRHHEFLVSDQKNSRTNGDTVGDRARSEERGVSHWRPSRRSKSEGPARSIPTMTNQQRRRDSDPDMDDTGRDSGLLKKAISKISTEYRLQFAWPQGHMSRRDASETPRKSKSMGALKPSANAMVHRKAATDFKAKNGTAAELEPLVGDSTGSREEEGASRERKTHTEYHQSFSKKEQTARKPVDTVDVAVKSRLQNGTVANNDWYKEVVELRKKAGEYKNRGWGSKLAPEFDLYSKPVEVWDQISRRSSLSALSLASTNVKTFNTKAEKDEENAKKSSPTKAILNSENSAKLMKDMIRHHLQRTTGGTEFDGLILSPTREKLEPTIPKRDDDSRGSQKNSPKKNSPQKSALQKKNSTKRNAKPARSQSVGPTDLSEKRSPKRQSRPATAAPHKDKKASAATTTTTANTNLGNVSVAKRPRPSSLNTTASSRSSSSSVPPKHEDERSAKSKPSQNCTNESNAKNQRKTWKTADKSENAELAETEQVILEPVVKSPPEPTRVKSPEQMIMRSPDPVNWTVPLDTGKTFTVTQNVRQGDIGPPRPHSEIKAWTPPDMPPPIAQSAPPQVEEQCKDKAGKHNSDRFGSSTKLRPNSVIAQQPPTLTTADTVAENSLQILNVASTATIEPNLCPYETLDASPESIEPSVGLSADVLRLARNRFDAFWGRSRSTDQV